MSDHTVGWIDFNTTALFPDTAYSSEAPELRQFVLTNKEKKRQYQEKLRDIHKHQQIARRIKTLEEDFEKTGQASKDLKTRYTREHDSVSKCSGKERLWLPAIWRFDRGRKKAQPG